MLEQILKLYWMAMAGDVRSPMPHLFGPPGCGKSTSVEQAAELLGVNLHIINVSRISPLELEGVQMPMTVTVDGGSDSMHLKMLTATFWTQLKEGDIVLLDEFLRGFPEVYNGLLDILTARRVGSFVLPKVFILGASNSTVAYDKALEDRLLHLPVPDPRKKKRVKKDMAELLVQEIGLLPQMAESMEMQQLLDVEVMPMFECLDVLGKGSASPVSMKGRSLRNLIGMAKLREIHSPELKELLNMNNVLCKQQSKHQYMVLPDASSADAVVYDKLLQLRGNNKVSPVQKLNIELNLQLIEMEQEKKEGSEPPDDVFLDDLS